MSTFKDSAQALIEKIKHDVLELDEFKPVVFVLKADGNHEVLPVAAVAKLVVSEDMRAMPPLNRLLTDFAELINNNKEAYEGECLGILFVGLGQVKSVDMAGLSEDVKSQIEDGKLHPAELKDARVVTATALSFNGRSITGKDDSIMQVYPCRTDGDERVTSVDAKALDLDSMCKPPSPPANGRFNFGTN